MTKAFPHECDIFQLLTGEENRLGGATAAERARDVWNAAGEAFLGKLFSLFQIQFFFFFAVHN